MARHICHLSSEERSELARSHETSAEKWLQRLIHHCLTEHYGADYLNKIPEKNANIAKIKSDAVKLKGKINWDIEATSLDILVKLVINEEMWKSIFHDVFKDFYPGGRSHLRQQLELIIVVRNSIAHPRVISARESEKAVCYANDFADCVRFYFVGRGMSKTFNAPFFTEFCDNIGNTEKFSSPAPPNVTRVLRYNKDDSKAILPGAVVVAEVAIDPVFASEDYTVSWWTDFHKGTGSIANIDIDNRCINESFSIHFRLVSTKDWHRRGQFDDFLIVCYLITAQPE